MTQSQQSQKKEQPKDHEKKENRLMKNNAKSFGY